MIVFSKYILKNLALRARFWGFACSQANINSINTFINFVIKFLIRKRTKRGVKALKQIKALLLSTLYFSARYQMPISLFCF